MDFNQLCQEVGNKLNQYCDIAEASNLSDTELTKFDAQYSSLLTGFEQFQQSNDVESMQDINVGITHLIDDIQTFLNKQQSPIQYSGQTSSAFSLEKQPAPQPVQQSIPQPIPQFVPQSNAVNDTTPYIVPEYTPPTDAPPTLDIKKLNQAAIKRFNTLNRSAIGIPTSALSEVHKILTQAGKAVNDNDFVSATNLINQANAKMDQLDLTNKASNSDVDTIKSKIQAYRQLRSSISITYSTHPSYKAAIEHYDVAVDMIVNNDYVSATVVLDNAIDDFKSLLRLISERE